MYHRAHKSVRENQIGFQKYKIHGDIKKQKGDEAERGEERGEERKRGRRQARGVRGRKESGETREREAAVDEREKRHADRRARFARDTARLHKFRIDLCGLRFSESERRVTAP